jgi:NADH-quinone oxidoreductase subunit J
MSAVQVLFWIYAALTCAGAVAVVVTQNVIRMAFWLIISLGSAGGLFFLLGADFVGATQLLIYVGGTVVLLIFGVMLTASGPYLRIKTSPAELFLSGGIGLLFLGMIIATVTAVDWGAAGLRVAGLEAIPQELFESVASGEDLSEAEQELLGEAFALDDSAAEPVYRLNRERRLTAGERDAVAALFGRDAAGMPGDRGELTDTARPIGMAFLGLRPDKDLNAPAQAQGAAGYLLPFEIASVHLLVVLVGAAYLARAKRRTRPQENGSNVL